MTTKQGPRQQIRILSEIPQVTFPEPGQPKIVMAITYQADMGPPRTVFVDQAQLPDALWRQEHPEVPQPPADLVKRGDEARRKAIQADMERRRAAPAPRTLEL